MYGGKYRRAVVEKDDCPLVHRVGATSKIWGLVIVLYDTCYQQG